MNSTTPWQTWRDAMPAARRWAYFDHAAVAPLRAPARDALVDWAQDVADSGDVHWLRWSQRQEQARQQAARMLGGRPEEIALVRNTTEGINLVAEGLDWRAGDNVVTLADEFPSNQYPWLNLQSRGVETRRLPVESDGGIDPARIAAACDERTRVVTISWVGYASGWRHDVDALAEVAHRRGALLFLDAIQGLGVFPLDVSRTPVDFLAADGHKWLLGPEGAGLFYTRLEHLERLRPIGVGWNSVVGSADFGRIDPTWKPTAARYEGGTWPLGLFAALGANLEPLLDVGLEAVAARVLEVTDALCAGLRDAGATVASNRTGERRSGIVSFDLPGRPLPDVRKHCLAQGVALSCRGGRLRASPHAYNNQDDIDRLSAAVRSFAG